MDQKKHHISCKRKLTAGDGRENARVHGKAFIMCNHKKQALQYVRNRPVNSTDVSAVSKSQSILLKTKKLVTFLF